MKLEWDNTEIGEWKAASFTHDEGVPFDYKVRLQLDGQYIASAESEIGLPSRGFETAGEARAYCEGYEAAQ